MIGISKALNTMLSESFIEDVFGEASAKSGEIFWFIV